MYDAIVVGARCAGSPTAMLLARKGYKVLLVDRATFPSDSMRNHFIQHEGTMQLHRWGLLDKIYASGCPPIYEQTIDIGDFPLTEPFPTSGDVAGTCAPRRFILDKILFDAASEAGAEVREGFSVSDIIIENDRVVGIKGKSKGGATITERARIVIGADGQNSILARAVNAPTYNEIPPLTCAYYSYWSNVPSSSLEIWFRPHPAFLLSFPTNFGLTCIAAQTPVAEFPTWRTDIEGCFLKTVSLVPELAERIHQGKREERFLGSANLPGYFRKPYGPGWALVGDAGYHKDPINAQGITDAFRDAELLATALDSGFSGLQPLDDALANYETQRNKACTKKYEATQLTASFTPFPRAVFRYRENLRATQSAT